MRFQLRRITSDVSPSLISNLVYCLDLLNKDSVYKTVVLDEDPIAMRDQVLFCSLAEAKEDLPEFVDSKTETVDTGTLKILTQSDLFINLQVNGKILKGSLKLSKQAQLDDIWALEQEFDEKEQDK